MKFDLLIMEGLSLVCAYIACMFTAYCVSRVDLLLAFIIMEVSSFTMLQTLFLVKYIERRTEVKK